MKLKGFCPGNKIPRGILMQGPEALKTGKNYLSLLYQLMKDIKMPNSLIVLMKRDQVPINDLKS